MTSPRWLKIRQLFEAACELGPAERASFLATSCDDEALRREIESLLDAGDRGCELIDAPAAEAFPELFETSWVGERVGAWRLVERLAAGGMGAVYRAVRADDQYDTTAAVKLIRQRLVSQRTLRRFRRERQTLAGLDHPFIARLLDGGVMPDGLPYLVMEYVDGRPVDRYCDEQRLSTRERLLLFGRICEAVAHAHRHLIVHRDLKPGNILVTPEGVPKLLDFGIAKVLDGPPADAAEPTMTLQRMMTPEYASPEQIRGEPITTASDIYSLGVVLFEMLTGRRPYRFTSRVPHEVERTICEADPQRPSTAVADPRAVSGNGEAEKLRRRLAGDLDEIILMALRKEPGRRYSTVEQLADDVRRHLRGLPVTARRDSLRYRAGKFIRRHRVGVAAGAVVVVSLLAGITAATWQSVMAGRAEQRMAAEAEKVRKVNALLTGMLDAIDPAAPHGTQEALATILDEAALSIGAGALADQPAVEAALRSTMGMMYLQLGAYPAAEENLGEALRLRQRELGRDHPDVADSLNNLGLLARAWGRPGQAERFYREALQLRRRLLGDEAAETAETMNNLGMLLKRSGRLDEAEELLRRALAVRRGVLEASPEGAGAARRKRHRADVATTMVNLAAVLKNTARYKQAEALYREALELLRAALGPQHYRVAVCQNNLALLLADTGRDDEAETLFRESLAIRRIVFGNEHRAVATGLKNLARLWADTGRYEEAEPLYREALELGRRLPGDDGRLANTLNSLADVLTALGRLDEAEPMAREALAIRRRADPDHPRLARSLLVLGRIAMSRGEPAAAESLLREALDRCRSSAGEPRDAARAAGALGRCLAALDRFPEAEALLLRSYEVLDGPKGSPRAAREMRRELIGLYERWGRLADAARYADGKESP